MPSQNPIEVRRSNRRKRSVSAFYEGGKLVVVIPSHFSAAQESEWVANMTARLAKRQARRRPTDAVLLARCRELSLSYLDGAAQPLSVAWSSNQNRRWGSCTIQARAIRISDRLQGMPPYVLDYVLLHELTHLLHADHGPGFWAILAAYPHLEKARGFLEGVDYQAHQQRSVSHRDDLPASGDDIPDDDLPDGDEFCGDEFGDYESGDDLFGDDF